MRHGPILAACLLPPILLVGTSGCASRAELAELREDVAALERDVAARDAGAEEALSSARATREELGEVRALAERAARDAAASRRLLEEMDERMGSSLGGGTFK